MMKYIYTAMIVLIPIISFAEELKFISKIDSTTEQRAISCLSSDEFEEEYYAGEYIFGNKKCVVIEDDRAGSGHLILKADCMGVRYPLYRFNRFIYVYGASPDSSEPVLGTVTFLSDGERVNQLLWQHDGNQAFFPMRR
jgi:hypothetical protein